MLARARGVPMVVQIGEIPDATRALLDAEQGSLELDPSDDAIGAFASRGAARPPPQRGPGASTRTRRPAIAARRFGC